MSADRVPVSDVEALRQEIAEALADLSYRGRNMTPAESRTYARFVLSVVTAWAEQQARERAAEELRAAAEEIDGDGLGGLANAYRRIYASDLIRVRAAALADDGRA